MDNYEIAKHLGEAGVEEDFEALKDSIVTSNKQMLPRLDREGQRAQHPKVHATLDAEFEVHALTGSDAKYAIGLFAKPTNDTPLKAHVRFSNSRHFTDNEEDGDAHGMAIKIFGVEGAKFRDEHNPDGSFDIVLMDNPTFFGAKLAQYEQINRRAAPIIDSRRNDGSQIAMKANKLAMQAWVIMQGDGLANDMKEASDQSIESLLAVRYWSTTPYLLGPEIAVKYEMRPTDTSISDAEKAIDRSDNYLHKRLRRALEQTDHSFDLYLQIQRNKDVHPIEDPTVPWVDPDLSTETDAHEVKVATLTIKKIGSVDDTEWREWRFLREDLGYNIWNVTADHRPLGAINRVRRGVYAALKNERDKLF